MTPSVIGRLRFRLRLRKKESDLGSTLTSTSASHWCCDLACGTVRLGAPEVGQVKKEQASVAELSAALLGCHFEHPAF